MGCSDSTGVVGPSQGRGDPARDYAGSARAVRYQFDVGKPVGYRQDGWGVPADQQGGQGVLADQQGGGGSTRVSCERGWPKVEGARLGKVRRELGLGLGFC